MADPLPPFQGRIFIDDDGQVVFENLDPGLAEVALALDPEAELTCDIAATDSPPVREAPEDPEA